MSTAEQLWSEINEAGHEPLVAFSVERAAQVIAQEHPQVVLVRRKLPDASGWSLINGVRTCRATSRVPIIVIGEDGADEYGCIRALEAGADDYVRKPYSVRELLVRIQVLLRPIEYRATRRLARVEDLTMDFDARRAFGKTGPDPADEIELKLVPACYRLLRFFVENPYVVLSRKDIIDNVWFGKSLSGSAVDVYINQLREVLRPLQSSLAIQTVRGAGFRLSKVAEATVAEESKVDNAVRARAIAAPGGKNLRDRGVTARPYEITLISNMDAAIEKIRQLQLLLLQKTKENESLRNAIEAAESTSPPKRER